MSETSLVIGLIMLVAAPIAVPVLFRLTGRPSVAVPAAVRRPGGGNLGDRVKTSMPAGPAIVVAVLAGAVLFSNTRAYVTPSVLIGDASTLAIVALGMAVVMKGRGIDLSIGGVVTLTAALLSMFADQMDSAPLILLGVLVAAVVVGYVNGLLIVHARLPAFAVTLAMLTGLTSLSYGITTGRMASLYMLKPLASGLFRPLPTALVVLVLVAAVVYFLRNRQQAAVWTYMFSSFLAGLAGILMVARMGAATPALGTGMEVSALAAALLGGASLWTGGAVFGAIIGALALELVRYGVVIIGMPGAATGVVLAVLLVIGLFYDRVRNGS